MIAYTLGNRDVTIWHQYEKCKWQVNSSQDILMKGARILRPASNKGKIRTLGLNVNSATQ